MIRTQSCIKNDHLALIFNKFLPLLENNNLCYWVYGGIAYAALAGNFYRRNNDVDILLKKSDFDKAEKILRDECSRNNIYEFIKQADLVRENYSRPKIDLKIEGIERLSLVPAYTKNDRIVLVFGNGPQEFRMELLERIKREIAGYKFYTPTDSFIKKCFIKCVNTRRNCKKVVQDGLAILSREDIDRL